MIAWSTVSFVGVGLYWQRRRPSSWIGIVLVVLGFVLAAEALQGSGNSLAFSIGVLLDAPAALLAAYAILSFPSGRLDRLGRGAMAIGLGMVVFGLLPWVLFSPQIQGGTPLARCSAACPSNALLLTDRADLAASSHTSLQAWRVAFGLALLLVIGLRLARSSRPGRRGLLVVSAVGSLWLVFFALYGAAAPASGPLSRLAVVLGICTTLTRCLLPLAFVLAPLRANAFAGVALERLIPRLNRATSAAGVEHVVADTLDDPALELAFWMPSSQAYVDSGGRPFETPRPGTSRLWTTMSRGDEPVVAIVHDAALVWEPELVQAVGGAVLLSLDNSRLQTELRGTIEQLDRSREEVVTAVAAERRRLESNLHDSAQQRLVALRIRLDLLRERNHEDPTLTRSLDELGAEVDEALGELRSLTRGLEPALIAEKGLQAALAGVAERASSQVRLGEIEAGRYPREIETAVYFCIVEAIQNAMKHGENRDPVTVSVRRAGDDLCFEVADDGRGFDLQGTQRGLGLKSMTERIAAIRGRLDIETAPGLGTVVRGRVPLDADPASTQIGPTPGQPPIPA